MNRRSLPPLGRSLGPTLVEPDDFRSLSQQADERVRRFVDEYEAEREKARRRVAERRAADERQRPTDQAPA